MKTKLILLLFLVIYSPLELWAQSPALKSLVDAEWSFINLAKETNTRDAFWAQFTNETIVFGEGPVNAMRAYAQQKPNNSWLKWEPIFSDIASSADFGYNTGPWEFRSLKTDEKAVAFGHFVSVWKKVPDGTWKLLLDIGIDHPQPGSVLSWKTSSMPFEKETGKIMDVKGSLLKREQNFIDEQSKNSVATYQKYLSAEARVYRPGREPMTDMSVIDSFLSSELPIAFKTLDGGVASTNDLAYVYGTAVIQIASTQTKSANYLRIWKNEGGRGWRIVLDLITYK